MHKYLGIKKLKNGLSIGIINIDEFDEVITVQLFTDYRIGQKEVKRIKHDKGRAYFGGQNKSERFYLDEFEFK